MRFQFRSENNISDFAGGVAAQSLPSGRPSDREADHQVVASEAPSFRRCSGKLHRHTENHPNPAEDEDEAHSKIKSNLTLLLERHEDDEDSPVDLSSKIKGRHYFRLGRYRSRSSSATESEIVVAVKSLSPPPCAVRRGPQPHTTKCRGIHGLRKPSMKRTMSLPIDLKSASTASDNLNAEVSPDASPIRRRNGSHVSFSSVQVREYCRVLGDHPCCPSGPPLSLGWEMEREDLFHFEEYEREREPARRAKDALRLGCEDRRVILESLTVSPHSSEDEGEGHSKECCLYSRAEIRKVERRLMRERTENHRVQRKMKHGFFKPVENDLLESPSEDVFGPNVCVAQEDTVESSAIAA